MTIFSLTEINCLAMWLVAGSSTAVQSRAKDAPQTGIRMPGSSLLRQLIVKLRHLRTASVVTAAVSSCVYNLYLYSSLMILSSYCRFLFYCCTVIDCDRRVIVLAASDVFIYQFEI